MVIDVPPLDVDNEEKYLKKSFNRLLQNWQVSLSLPRFFIGYWILKTGLDVHPGPFLF